MNAQRMFIGLLILGLLLTPAVGVVLAQGPTPSSGEGESGVRVAPLGTAFTYQGRLTDGGSPASGSYDFRFILYNAAMGGSQVGGIVTVDDQAVTEGLFTVLLDFGSAFTGSARYLEVAVRPGASTGAHTILSPRQALTPAPNALNADRLDGQHASAFASVAHNHTPGNIVPQGAGSGLDADRLDGQHASAFWALAGNSGTSPGTHFLGTADNQALELKVNGARVLRLEPHAHSPNVIGGYSGNGVTSGASGATIAGGGESGLTNRVTDNYGTAGGGRNHQAGDGDADPTDAPYATVGGGYSNDASGDYATVPGGRDATASHYGEMAYASSQFASDGDAQTSVYVLRNTTTNATPTNLFLNGSVYRLTIAPTATVVFDILVVARSVGDNSAGYVIRGIIENDDGVTSFIGVPSVIAMGEDRPAWNVGVTADNVIDALVIWVIGEAGFTIRWVATVRTVEVEH